MVVPLALALATVPPMADLARGEAEFLRGNAHCDAREFSDALVSYDRAAAFGYADPNNGEAWNNKGFTFFMLGIHEEALACYEQALAINPRYKQAWYNKGSI